MSKRTAFIATIALLHLMTTATVIAAARGSLSGRNADTVAGISARLLLSPLFYPVRHVTNAPGAHGMVAPLILANSLLWGVMAERLVFGRKNVYRKKRGASQ